MDNFSHAYCYTETDFHCKNTVGKSVIYDKFTRIFFSNSTNIHLASHSFIQTRRSEFTDVLVFPYVEKTCEFTEIIDVIGIKTPENGLMILKTRLQQ